MAGKNGFAFKNGLFAAMMACVSSGCAGSSPPPISAAQASQGLDAYKLGAGDSLRITVYNEPNLTGEYALSSSGSIAFPLIGSVDANGLTLEQVTAVLTQKIGNGYMTNPKVSAEVVKYRPFYILGEVKTPGQYPFSAGMTIEQAIAAAGGFTYRANQKLVDLRRSVGGQDYAVNLRRGPQAVVMPGDTIRVKERYF